MNWLWFKNGQTHQPAFNPGDIITHHSGLRLSYLLVLPESQAISGFGPSTFEKVRKLVSSGGYSFVEEVASANINYGYRSSLHHPQVVQNRNYVKVDLSEEIKLQQDNIQTGLARMAAVFERDVDSLIRQKSNLVSGLERVVQTANS